MKRFLFWIVSAALCFGGVFVSEAAAQRSRLQKPGAEPLHYTYVRRNDARPGDLKVVVVPAIHPRQAKIDAQTYHIGWDAVDAWMGQSRVMYCVLLKKRPPYVPGTPPVPRTIPKERRN